MWSLGNFFQKIINMYTPLLGELEYGSYNQRCLEQIGQPIRGLFFGGKPLELRSQKKLTLRDFFQHL